ncbi:MAG: hypothetical protein ACLRNQ_29605 [Flavonifractor plautii]
MNIKKPLALLLAAGMTLGLAACGNGSQGNSESPAPGGETGGGSAAPLNSTSGPSMSVGLPRHPIGSLSLPLSMSRIPISRSPSLPSTIKTVIRS